VPTTAKGESVPRPAAVKWMHDPFVHSILAMRMRGVERLPLTTRIRSMSAVSPQVGQSSSNGLNAALTAATSSSASVRGRQGPWVSGSRGYGNEPRRPDW
jgi:hypothetical protein